MTTDEDTNQPQKKFATLEKLGDLVDQLVEFYIWNQVNALKDLDRDEINKAAAGLLQLNEIAVVPHLVDHLVISAVASGRYEQMQDPEQKEQVDDALWELGFTASELQRHWH